MISNPRPKVEVVNGRLVTFDPSESFADRVIQAIAVFRHRVKHAVSRNFAHGNLCTLRVALLLMGRTIHGSFGHTCASGVHAVGCASAISGISNRLGKSW